VSDHEPREAFVAQLEERLLTDLHRQRVAPPWPRWMPRTARGLTFAAAATVLVSMGTGGAIVSATYEVHEGAQRDALLVTFQQRHELAAGQLALARQRLTDLEQRVKVGIAGSIELPEARFAVTRAEIELQLAEIDIAEVRASGREPVRTVSAPLVAGRDFVTDRWQVESQVSAAALQVARQAVDAARRRFDVGMANNGDVEEASARLVEFESAMQLAQQRLAIRRAFLKRELTAAAADLRVMEAETEQRRLGLSRRIEFSRRQLQDVRTMAQIGTLSPLDLAEAELRLQELQLALTKADYDLALIRKQLGK
jgi:outer membrane protein TolC